MFPINYYKYCLKAKRSVLTHGSCSRVRCRGCWALGRAATLSHEQLSSVFDQVVSRSPKVVQALRPHDAPTAHAWAGCQTAWPIIEEYFIAGYPYFDSPRVVAPEGTNVCEEWGREGQLFDRRVWTMASLPWPPPHATSTNPCLSPRSPSLISADLCLGKTGLSWQERGEWPPGGGVCNHYGVRGQRPYRPAGGAVRSFHVTSATTATPSSGELGAISWVSAIWRTCTSRTHITPFSPFKNSHPPSSNPASTSPLSPVHL